MRILWCDRCPHWNESGAQCTHGRGHPGNHHPEPRPQTELHLGSGLRPFVSEHTITREISRRLI